MILEAELAQLRETVDGIRAEAARRTAALESDWERQAVETQRVTTELSLLQSRAVQAEQKLNTTLQAVSTVTGMLEKRGHKWTTGWKPRQCILEGQTFRCGN